MFHRVLVANRGEIAVRVIRACRDEGLESVAVFSDEDRGALHTRLADAAVEIGKADPADSYLNAGKLIDAARSAGCDAVHPGYGFLSENAAFAKAVADAGLVWIGPPAGVIAAVGDKLSGKALAQRVDVPTVPGYSRPGATDEDLLTAGMGVGFPLLVKASGGGGGRGMIGVRQAAELADAIGRARAQALSAFGNGELLLERYLERPRHIEVQVLADAHGAVAALGERDCSIQRRHQKIVEETPAPLLSDEERWRLHRAAVRLLEEARYVNAGTVEFLRTLDGNFYFLEVNSRIQVEHPVTELCWGLDLVRWQLKVARGERLNFAKGDLKSRGHAVEARVCAEDPDAGFLPTPGRIDRLSLPSGPGVRVDSGLVEGQAVGERYDSLLAKAIAWGESRQQAIERLDRALSEFLIIGCRTNIGLLRDILETASFRRGELSIQFLAEQEGALARSAARRRREVAVFAAALELSGACPDGGQSRGSVEAPLPAADPFDGRAVGSFRLGGA